jgi:hypothetical protein
MQRTNIYLADDQIAALDEMAATRGVSRAEVVRAFIQQGLSGKQGLDGDLTAITRAFGSLRDVQPEELEPLRGSGDRERHLDRVRSL